MVKFREYYHLERLDDNWRIVNTGKYYEGGKRIVLTGAYEDGKPVLYMTPEELVALLNDADRRRAFQLSVT